VSSLVNTRVVLASFPRDLPTSKDFRIEKICVPPLREGEVLLRTRYVSVDAHMRGHRSSEKSGAPSFSIGDVIEADATAEVLASNDPAILPGTIVLAKAGWQTHAIVRASAIDRFDFKEIPEMTALAVLGTPAFTAYAGLAQIGKPQPGETLVVPAALGAVGTMVGQFGRIAGAWTVGIVSGPDEVAFARNELGFGAAVDHTLPDWPSRLAEACPDGIDVYFETIGGALWHMILPMLNDGARVVLSGTPAQYNHGYGGASQYQHPSTLQWLVNSTGTIGAIQPPKTDFAEFLAVVDESVRTGAIWHRIHVVEGLEHAAEAWLTAIDGPNYSGRIIQVTRNTAT